ncbi:hypothetical protein [Micromonospora sp. CPCC 205556]|uniref:hypothetical protein n=1 Tax=Micromonospora sp. CPCC 205556 TaxID=3122398 RepID=UPI003FA5F051
MATARSYVTRLLTKLTARDRVHLVPRLWRQTEIRIRRRLQDPPPRLPVQGSMTGH